MHDAVPWPARATLLVASALTVMAGAIVAPGVQQTAELFEAQYPHSGALLAKLVLSLPALAIAGFAPVSGFVVDRFGSRKLLLAGLLLYAVFGTTGVYLRDAYAVLAGRLGLGMAVAMVMTTATSLISAYFHGPHRGRFLGWQATAMALGGVFFLPLGGWLTVTFGPAWAYILYVVSLPVALAAYRTLPEPPRRNDPNLPPTPPTGDYPMLVHWRTIGLIYGIAFVGMAAYYLAPPQMAFLLLERFDEGPLTAAWAVSTMTLLAAMTSVNYGRLSLRIPTTYLLAAFFACLGLGFWILARMSPLGVAWVGLMIAGLGGGLYTPTLSNWLMRVAPPPLRGRLTGGLIAAIFSGQFLSPILAQPAVLSWGVPNLFARVGLILLGTSLVFMGSRRFYGLAKDRRRRRLARRTHLANSPKTTATLPQHS